MGLGQLGRAVSASEDRILGVAAGLGGPIPVVGAVTEGVSACALARRSSAVRVRVCDEGPCIDVDTRVVHDRRRRWLRIEYGPADYLVDVYELRGRSAVPVCVRWAPYVGGPCVGGEESGVGEGCGAFFEELRGLGPDTRRLLCLGNH